MKKIFSIISAALILFSVTSCDLDREPVGEAQQAPFSSYKEIGFYYDGVYQYLRSAENPSNYGLSDYLTNYYTSSDIDGGTWAPFFHWDKSRLLDNDMINGYYAAYSVLTMQANYFIMRGEEALNNNLLEKKDEIDRLKKMVNEAKVMKAVSIYRLMLRYQNGRYTKDNCNEPNSGVCLAKDYNPLAMLPRATKKESYDYALQLLDEALNGGLLKKSDFAGVPDRITDDYAHAMKARIYLQMQEYGKAIEECDKFINNYPLISLSGSAAENIQKLIDLYADKTSENMVQLYANSRVGTFGQMPGWIGGSWVPSKKVKGKMFYRIYPLAFPSKETVDLFTSNENDLRGKAWIKETEVVAEGFPTTPLITKFTGNLAYETIPERPTHRCPVNLCNIAEIYLIKAEAAASEGDANEAQDALSALAAARGFSFDPIADPDDALNMVKLERRRELIGEGMYLNDMQRWNMPFVSGTPNASNDIVRAFNNQVKVSIPAGSPLFSWEFPRNDRQSNKNLKGNWD
ncbi:MAG: RagB/SusD family nutrient uptake outer membrane protein [Porphyromonadaceae bacterium]|nr:RagB/SusD family nutrient uptake outer membrane protein [Porphyromonadaceae bacterium]